MIPDYPSASFKFLRSNIQRGCQPLSAALVRLLGSQDLQLLCSSRFFLLAEYLLNSNTHQVTPHRPVAL
jgi:hypothetical protein